MSSHGVHIFLGPNGDEISDVTLCCVRNIVAPPGFSWAGHETNRRERDKFKPGSRDASDVCHGCTCPALIRAWPGPKGTGGPPSKITK